MKLLHWIPCLLVFVLVGCGSKNGPQFSTRDSADQLIAEARVKLEETIVEGFGTPNDLVAWTQMPIDFGSFSGTVEAVGSTPGSAQVELVSVAGSALATDARLDDLAGAGVVVPGHQGVLRVGTYEVDDSGKHTVHRLEVVDETGAGANVDFVKHGSLWLQIDSEKLAVYEMNADDLASSLQNGGLLAQVKGERFEVSNGTDKLAWNDIASVKVPHATIGDILSVGDPVEDAGEFATEIDVSTLKSDFGLEPSSVVDAVKAVFPNTELSQDKETIRVNVKKTVDDKADGASKPAEDQEEHVEITVKDASEITSRLNGIAIVSPIPISMGRFIAVEEEERDGKTVVVLTPEFVNIDKFGLSLDDVIATIEDGLDGDDSKPIATLESVRGSFEVVATEGNKIGASDLEDMTLFVPAFDLSEVASSKVAYHDVKVVGAGLQHGRDLYLRHCMHCHGVSGDGAGPTAEYLNPLPRDYRDGIIKFTSTDRGLSPNRHDLYRIVKLGVPGTYMPSFMLLPDDDVKAIAEYVRFLATRGQIETLLLGAMSGDYSISDDETPESAAEKLKGFTTFVEEDFADSLTESAEIVAEQWTNADQPENVITPERFKKDYKDKDGNDVADIVERPILEVGSDEFKASLKRGRELFLSDKNKCAGCHGEKGRGDGASTEDHVPVDGVPAKEPGYFDMWGNQVKPRNLTQGFFRGGRRPIDIYRRIRIGIKGTPMPGNTDLSNADTWHLINYVLNIPFED